MGARESDRSYVREFLKSRSGVVGLVMLVLLLAASIYVLVSTPTSEVYKWENPAAWQGNPASAPPVWVNYFGVDAPQTVGLSLGSWSSSTSGGSSVYSASAT